MHPVAFMIATSWVIIVLYQRDFRSHSQRIVSGEF
jgi:uncharacterized membrane protein